MSEISGIYAIFLREWKAFLREKGRVIGAVVTPLMWLFILGSGIGSTVGDNSYQNFIFPGIIGMTILFTCMFYGTYIIWDKKVDFFKEVLVAPISRLSIFWGKVLGGLIQVFVQLVIMIAIGFLLGIHFTPYSVLMTVIISTIIAIGLLSIGIIFGVMLDSMESFGLIINFVIYPMFFLSGALYSLQGLPTWLSIITKIDPLTYGVDALRNVILGTSKYSLLLDTSVIIVFAVILMVLGTLSFRRLR